MLDRDGMSGTDRKSLARLENRRKARRRADPDTSGPDTFSERGPSRRTGSGPDTFVKTET
jgi:hypothetical protein